MSKRYAVTYVVKVKRMSLVGARNEEEAEEYVREEFDYLNFDEEDTEFYDIEDIEEIPDNDF